MPIVKTKATRSNTWWVGIAVFVLAAAAMVIGRGYGRAGIMPNLAALSIMILAGVHTVYGILFGVFANNEEWHSDEEKAEYVHRRLMYVLAALGAGIGIWLVGFHITLPIFLFLFIAISTRNWIVATAMALVIWLFTFIVLKETMHIVFPTSVLQKWLIATGHF